MSTLNLVFAGLSITCAVLSAVMFVLARRAAEHDRRATGPRHVRAPQSPRSTASDDDAHELDEYDEYDDEYVAEHHGPGDDGEYDDGEYEDGYDDEYEVAEAVAAAPPRSTPGAGARLPKGAEAALWAITETVPDPRNHIVLKDPTSEVRLHPILTGGGSPGPTDEGRDDIDDRSDDDGGLREGRMRGAIDETDVFTGEFFFAGEPKLNRF